MSTDNTTLPFDPEQCTLDTCPLDYANFSYIPSLGGNLSYTIIFAVILLAQLGFGIRYKTWGFLVGMIGGLALEIIGYIGRIQAHYNPFPFGPFAMQIVCLTIAPAFLTASIYLCLARIVVSYGTEVSRLRPRAYTYIFVACDLVSLVLQSVGGAITATGDDKATKDIGLNIMIAGLAFQVISMTAFIAICIEYGIRVSRKKELLNENFAGLRSTFMFKAFLCALVASTIFIFIRCLFRVAELSAGFGGSLANNEVLFMIFEGPMIILGTLVLIICHPGFAFAGRWMEARPLTKKQREGEKTDESFHADVSSDDNAVVDVTH